MIRVVVDDLAFVTVDAVLRPADASLDPVTPSGVRLDRQAGAAFASQRRVSSPLEAGAAVVTGAGELAAPLVVHVVIQDPHSSAGRETIRRALVSAWQRAGEWQLATLAAPPIGAGAGLLAVDEAVQLMAETFPSGRQFPRELSIVVEREDDRVTVEAALRRRTG